MAHGNHPRSDAAAAADTPNTVRSFMGRRMSGPILTLRAVRGSRGWRLSVQQKSGPTQNFVISRTAQQGRVVPRRILGVVRVVVGVLVMLFSALLMITGIQQQLSTDEEFMPFLLAELTFLCTLLLGQRLAFTNSLRHGHQVCPHIVKIGKVLKEADPAEGTWAVEAVDALRQGTFCHGSPQLHAMALGGQPPRAALETASAADRLSAQVRAAAGALEAHGRPADAGVVRELLECVPELAVLDQAAVGQAADAVTRSYALLEEVPVALREIPTAVGSPTPQQDADASVGAALAELTRLVRVHADNDIQALQALRIYTRQWDRSNTLDL